MPIRPFLDDHRFDPETIRIMGLPFEMALIALRLGDRGDLENEIVARKIIALAKAGESDPEQFGPNFGFTKSRLRRLDRLSPISGRRSPTRATCRTPRRISRNK